MLEVKNLHYCWPNSIEQRIDVVASPGEFLFINGRSGIGKTTFFEVLAGFHKPVSGKILWKGVDLQTSLPWKRPISVMFQKNNLFLHLSIKENLSLCLKKTRIPSDYVEYCFEKLNVKNLLNRKPNELSGGELQRISLINSVVRKQPILLLDEPFSALDKEMIEQASQLLVKNSQVNDVITFIISHQPAHEFIKPDKVINLTN